MSIYASLHTHSYDLFDCMNEPDELFRRLREMGAKGAAITQHGAMSVVDKARMAAEKYGLKYVPGVELYVDGSHLVLLAADAEGYRALCILVSETCRHKDGMAHADFAKLQSLFAEGKPYHGHVIATTACIGGVIAGVLEQNRPVYRELAKCRKVLESDSVIPDDDREWAETLTEEYNLRKQVEAVQAERNAAKKTSEKRFAQREKRVASLFAKADPSAPSEAAKLEAEKQEAENAKTLFISLSEDLVRLKKELGAVLDRKAVMRKKVDRFNELKRKECELKGKLVEENELELQAESEMKAYDALFGHGNFFAEIQYHGFPDEKRIYRKVSEIAKKLGIPPVASNDVHILSNTGDERLRRQTMVSMRYGSRFEPERKGDEELYLKTDEELREALSRLFDGEEDMWVDAAVRNIQTVFDRCNVEFPQETHYPRFPSPSGKTAEEMLDDEIRRGIRWRFPKGLPKEYWERLHHELDVIKSMGYADYHLVVKDFLEYARALAPVPPERLEEAPLTIEGVRTWAKKHGWTGGYSVGPGRGSAVGSLACYLLGITALDPVKYNLFFERFLNPERVSMPDIDSDVSNAARKKVISYIRAKYGEDSVCGIMTMNFLAPRGALRTAARFYGMREGKDCLKLGDAMARLVPEAPGTQFSSDADGKTVAERIRGEFPGTDAAEILEWAQAIEGTFTSYGAHAAGIVISDGTPVKECIPLRWNGKLQEYTTQCDMVAVEENGFLKMDVLGLKTLDVIGETLHLIKENYGKEIDPLTIPLDDRNVYREIFCRGRTDSVFQFESKGMKRMLRRFEPGCFDDLVILVSMFRPGPLQYIDGIIDVKTGKKKPEYLTDKLKPILGRTYGGIVYQEQIMEIFQKLAGYTLGGADQVRRYMSKKKADKLAKEREAFLHGDAARGIDGCVKRGIPEHAASELFRQMTDFARYAFNASHATAYAHNSYVTAYLKYYYPAEFLSAAMNFAELEKIPGLAAEAKAFRLEVLPPCVNSSGVRFRTENGNIRYGLRAVRNVGSSAEKIVGRRGKKGYKDIREFFLKADVEKEAVVSLIRAGACSSICGNRRSALEFYEAVRKDLRKRQALLKEYRDLKQAAEEAMTRGNAEAAAELELKLDACIKKGARVREQIESVPVRSCPPDRKRELAEERGILGICLSGDPLSPYRVPGGCLMTAELNKENDNRDTAGLVRGLRVIETKKTAAKMAVFEIEDAAGAIPAVMFPEAYVRAGGMLEEGAALLFHGRTSLRDGEGQYVVEYAEKLKDKEAEKE